MKTVIVLSAALLIFLDRALVAEERESGPVKLEKKLLGEWKGGPCMGNWTFGKDGEFALTNYSPGGNKFTGEWKVRWDGLPPTLELTFKTSNAPIHFKVGDTWKVKINQLDDDTFGYSRPDNPKRVISCTRR